MDGSDNVVLRAALRHLLEAARRERGLLPAASAERQFLLGVDAAALEALHPELSQTRAGSWLDRETSGFRDGYHRTRTAIADAGSSGHVPTSIPIPRPDRGGVR